MLSRDYWRALQVSLAFQIAFGLMAVTATSAATLLQWWRLAMAVYWAGLIVIFLRRPNAPTALDLFLVRWAFPPLMVLIVPLLTALIWRLRAL